MGTFKNGHIMISIKQFNFSIIIILAGAITGIIIGGFYSFIHDLPEIRSLNSYKPSSVTRIYSSDNVMLTEIYAEKRDPISIDDTHLIQAETVFQCRAIKMMSEGLRI